MNTLSVALYLKNCYLLVCPYRVNSRYGPNTVDYAEIQGSVMPMHERVALWQASDLFMLSAIR
jgi:hypothetical protein